MPQRKRVLEDFWAAHPGLDYLLPIAVGIAWWQFGRDLAPADASTRITIYGGVATLSGLVLASATFICALTYQSANILLADVRKRFAGELRRNWFSIIMSAFWVAVVALGCMVLDDDRPKLATTVAVAALALLAARAGRSALWLHISLFTQQASDQLTPEYDMSKRQKGASV